MDNNLIAVMIPATVTVLTALIAAYVEIVKMRQKDDVPGGSKSRKDTRKPVWLIGGVSILLSIVGAFALLKVLPSPASGIGTPLAIAKPVIQQLGNRFYGSLADWGEAPIDVQDITPIGGVVEPFSGLKNHLMVFVCPIATPGSSNAPVLCNQHKLILKASGEWLDTVTLGSPTDACRKFELLVVVANDQMYEATKKYPTGIQEPALRNLLHEVGHAERLVRVVTEANPSCSGAVGGQS